MSIYLRIDLRTVTPGSQVKLRDESIKQIDTISCDESDVYPFNVTWSDGTSDEYTRAGRFCIGGESAYDIIEIIGNGATSSNGTTSSNDSKPVVSMAHATLRDMYFCAALTGILTALDSAGTREGIVRHAFEIADEALKQRPWK